VKDSRRPQLRQVLREAFAHIDPEGPIAVLEPLVTPERRERLNEVLDARVGSVTAVMDAPHSPHNGAAVMRSCDAFGVGRIHVVERLEHFSVSNVVAKGSERWVDVIAHHTVEEAVQTVSDANFTLVGAHPTGKLLPADLAEVPRLALVMGNEHDGICEELNRACDSYVRVPMRGFVESLNVSVTAAILLSNAVAGRSGDLEPRVRRRLYARWLALSVPRSLHVLAAHGIEPLAASPGGPGGPTEPGEP
jgi:tRNA (guanosine-2'-O-)-methyltransferase